MTTLQPDPCRLEGPCGLCATLTPAMRAILVENLAALGAALADDLTEDGALPKEDAAQIQGLDTSKLSIVVDGPVRITPLDVKSLVGASSLNRTKGAENVVEGPVDEGRELLDVERLSVVQLGHSGVVPLDEFVGQGRVFRGERDRSAVAHDASPSAGESAEPGLASTLSVEGEPAAGGPFAESPAVTPAAGYRREINPAAGYRREINPAALRSIRELAGVRSGDFARSAGISHGFLSNIEAGRKQPSPSVVHAFARRLGVPIDAITQTT